MTGRIQPLQLVFEGFAHRPVAQTAFEGYWAPLSVDCMMHITQCQQEPDGEFIMISTFCSESTKEQNWLRTEKLVQQTRSMGLAYVLLGGYWEQKFDTQFDGCNSQPEFVIYIPFTKCKNNVEKQLKSVLVDALISPLFESSSSKVVVVAKFSGITEAELHIHFAQKVVSETAQAEFVNNADLTDEKEQIFVFESINQPSNYLGKLAFQQRGQIWEI